MQIKNTRPIFCILVVLSSISFAEEQDAAEFLLSEKLLKQFSLTGKKTAPFLHEGHLMHPNLNLNVQIQLKDGNNGIAADLGVDLRGRTATHSSQMVGPFKGHQVNVTVQSDLDASYRQSLLLNQGGLNAGTPKGTPKITPHIFTSNDFRLPRLNAKVNGIAASTARQMSQKTIKKDKVALDNQIRSNLINATSNAQQFLNTAMNQVSALVEGSKPIPFQAKYSSQAGEKGNMKVQLKDTKSNTDRKAKPILPHADQEASHFVLHEDVLNKIIGEEIAGQEMRLSDLKEHLCGPKTKNFLNFCKTEMPKDMQELSIIFEKDKPIEFTFENGTIGMKLNAAYRLSKEEENADGNPLFNNPDKKGKTGRTIPYSVDFSYAIDNNKAKLKNFRVTDRNTGNTRGAIGMFASLMGENSHADSQQAAPAAILMSRAIREKVEASFKKALVDEFEWPAMSIPSKVQVDMNNPSREVKTSLLDVGSLMPLDTKAENGWLALSTYYCSEKTPSFGVSFRNSKVGNGIRVSNVFEGSPASFLGLKIGDTIEAVSKNENFSEGLQVTEESFLGIIKQSAQSQDPSGRKLWIKGVDKGGKAFSKEAVLCPSGYPHRENANKLISSIKSLK